MKNDRAYICFCVEGPSDRIALKQQFEQLFDERFGDSVQIDFRIPQRRGESEKREPQGDLTSMLGVTPENIEKNIYKFYFKNQEKDSDLAWNDFTSIVHIIDIDGVYSKDITLFSLEEERFADSLCTGKKQVNTLYLSDHIAVRKDPSALLDIHRKKIHNIDYLRNKNEIASSSKQPAKKYSLYYFSSNLDHVLYGNANLESSLKKGKAKAFSEQYNTGKRLLDFFQNFSGCSERDYECSWELLWKDNNSLQPHSNINILLDRVINSSLNDWK